MLNFESLPNKFYARRWPRTRKRV